MFYKKQKPKFIQCRNCKTFNEQLFRIELEKELAKIDLNNAELAELHNEFLSVLNKHAPIKNKYIQANNSNYMTKSSRKEIMLCSILRNKFLKTKKEESKQLYNKERNLCVTLLRRDKRNYLPELNKRILKILENFGKQSTRYFQKKHAKEKSLH